MAHKPFILLKRPTTKPVRFIYYCKFRDNLGNLMTPISTYLGSKSASIKWVHLNRERFVNLLGYRVYLIV